MKLMFRQRYLSITSFPEIEIPKLTVILGINGSGKSHLLQAIENGHISNDLAPVQINPPHQQNKQIRLLQASQEFPQEPNAYSPPSAGFPGGATFDYVRSLMLAAAKHELEAVCDGRAVSSLNSGEDLWRIGSVELARRLGAASRADIDLVYQRANEQFPNTNLLPQPVQGDIMSLVPQVERISKKLGIDKICLDEVQLRQHAHWGTTDQFQPNLALIFGRYRDAMVRNRLMRLSDDDNRTKMSVTDAVFTEQFDRPPWTQFNETLEAFRLPYEVVVPDLYGFSPVSFALRKIPSGDPVSFHSLSSGEKVLLQFAISSFQYNDDLLTVTRPSLLLLDEMDGPLHPEMVHRWLGAVGEGLVALQGVYCVLSTHSPTTVALAPEEALFEMIDGANGLKKISKQDALNRLTFGVPTLSINYSGRRQVFTESDTVASLYESVYTIVKSAISCERELNFLSTGMRTKDAGEINSGCVVVRKLVRQLSEGGNNSVFGIVDWDGSAVSDERVIVLAEGARDGIENLLLDPLLLCLLMIKIRVAPTSVEDLSRFVSAGSFSNADIQRLIDSVQYQVFPVSSSPLVEVSYLGGFKANVLEGYLTMDDHELENLISEKFSKLRRWSSAGKGKLARAIVDEVLLEYRDFCPLELTSIFETISNKSI